MVWISKSDVISFWSCPLCWKESKEEQIQEFVFPMWVGSMVHDFHNFFWKGVRLESGEVQLPLTPDYFMKNKLVSKYILNLVMMELNRWEEIKKLNNIDIEKLFYPTFIEKRIEVSSEELKGIVDRVEWIGEKNYRIVELKTGRCYLDKHILEISFYKHILEKKYKMNITEGRIDYPTLMETKSIIFNDEIMNRTMDIVKIVKSKIEHNDFFISDENLCEEHYKELKEKGVI